MRYEFQEKLKRFGVTFSEDGGYMFLRGQSVALDEFHPEKTRELIMGLEVEHVLKNGFGAPWP